MERQIRGNEDDATKIEQRTCSIKNEPKKAEQWTWSEHGTFESELGATNNGN